MSEIIEGVPEIVLQSIDKVFLYLLNYYESYSSYAELLKDLIILYITLGYLEKFYRNIVGYGIIGYPKIVYHRFIKKLFRLILSLPFIKPKVDEEVTKTLIKLEESIIVKSDPSKVPDFLSLPKKGVPEDQLEGYLRELADLKHSEWEDGKVSGAVYHGGEDLIKVQTNAFETFCVSNQLHPDVFPGLRKMESEVISMVLELFHAPPEGCGVSTSGGTESLLLACLSAKVFGENNKGITQPEIIIPESAHAGFNKAAYYFNIKLHSVRLDPITSKVDLNQVRKLINKNTVLIVGSAPNYPHGIIDDIEGLSKLATKYKIPLHVDCCLGSFVIAYASKAGFKDLPLFDFQVDGVTSISCDTHKYGFAPKGSSILMYRNPELRKSQYYIDTDWIGGIYGTSNLSGSRPGAIMSGCWATLVNIGDDGYTKSAKDIISAARLLRDRINKEIPELEVIGNPLVSVVSFKSAKIDIYELSDAMNKEHGWHLSTLQKPAALHLAVTRLSIPKIDELIELLKIEIAKLLRTGATTTKSDTASLYGIAGSVSTAGVVDRLVVGFIDTLYKPAASQ